MKNPFQYSVRGYSGSGAELYHFVFQEIREAEREAKRVLHRSRFIRKMVISNNETLKVESIIKRGEK